jgi:predicted nucleic acid-binding protein
MSKYVIDAHTWIEYLDGSEAGHKVSALIEKTDEICTCAMTIAEVISKVAHKGKNVQVAYAVLLSNSQIVTADEALSLQAELLHFEMRKTVKDFRLADAYVLATARKLKSKILTGDAHFKSVKEAIITKKFLKPKNLYKKIILFYAGSRVTSIT